MRKVLEINNEDIKYSYQTLIICKHFHIKFQFNNNGNNNNNDNNNKNEGACGVMVIVVGNKYGDTSSNPGPDWLHFT